MATTKKKKKEPIVKVVPADRHREVSGTGLSGYIFCPYKNIVALLGKPNATGDGYKVDAEWIIEMKGTIMTIYNYKDGKNYNGRKGIATSKITEWHIGSHGYVNKEIKALQKILNPKKKSKVLGD